MPDQEDINNQVKLLKVHRQTLAHLLRQQAAQGGSAFAAVSVLNGIQDCRNQIRRIKRILSEWEVGFENHPDDSDDAFTSSQAVTNADASEPTVLPDDLCPYIGLNTFYEEHEHLFFGRERIIDDLVEKLNTDRLLVLVGPSGSGKSSLVRAGLIPKLKAGALPGSQFWLYPSPITPGSTPVNQLLEANIRDIVSGKKSNITSKPTCLVVDDFEKLFTTCPDMKQQQLFAKSILYLIRDTQKHRVIITMRSEMIQFVVRFPELQTAFERSVYYIVPMSFGEFRDSILQPAQQVGLKFDPKVIEALFNDILGEPEALPLLQFSLLKLWENREHNKITMKAFTRVGGGRLAVARHAEQFYQSLLPEQQILARKVLSCLVSLSNSLNIINRSVRIEDLYSINVPRERIDDILMKLIQAHLVRVVRGNTPEDNEYAVAHESLPRNWPRWGQWIDDSRAK